MYMRNIITLDFMSVSDCRLWNCTMSEFVDSEAEESENEYSEEDEAPKDAKKKKKKMVVSDDDEEGELSFEILSFGFP